MLGIGDENPPKAKKYKAIPESALRIEAGESKTIAKLPENEKIVLWQLCGSGTFLVKPEF